jgi:hypothetical protein
MVGQEDTGTLSTNHVRAFRPSFSKAETGFQPNGILIVASNICRALSSNAF